MSGDFIVQSQNKDAPLSEQRFSDFPSLARFIEEHKSNDWSNSVSIHVPSQTTDEQRSWLRAQGLRGDF